MSFKIWLTCLQNITPAMEPSRYVRCSTFVCTFSTLIHYRRIQEGSLSLKFWGEEAAKMQFCVYSSRVSQMATRKPARDGGRLGNTCQKEIECAKYHPRNTYEFCYSTTNPTPGLTKVCEVFSSLPFPDRINFCKLKKSALPALYIYT